MKGPTRFGLAALLVLLVAILSTQAIRRFNGVFQRAGKPAGPHPSPAVADDSALTKPPRSSPRSAPSRIDSPEEYAMRNARLEFVDDLAPPLSLAEEEAYLRREGRSIMALVGIALNRAISLPPDERAVALLREAMEKDPGNPLPYQALFTRDLDFQLDEKLVDRCLQFHPNDGDVLLMKAEIARNAGKADEAARWAAKAANSRSFGEHVRRLIEAATTAYEGAGRDHDAALLRGFYHTNKSAVSPFSATQWVGIEHTEVMPHDYNVSVAALALRLGDVPGLRLDDRMSALRTEKKLYEWLGREPDGDRSWLQGRDPDQLKKETEAEADAVDAIHGTFSMEREFLLTTLNHEDQRQFLTICRDRGEGQAFQWIETERKSVVDDLKRLQQQAADQRAKMSRPTRGKSAG